MRKLLALLLISLMLCLPVRASLVFAADTDRVDHATSTTLDLGTTGTIMLWIYLTDDTARQSIYARNTSPAYYDFSWRADLAGDNFIFGRERATTPLLITAAAANFANYATNKWIFIACVFNTGGASGAQKMLIGDLDSEAAEPSSYVGQDLGTGTVDTTYGSGPFIVGNGAVNTRETKGRIAVLSINTNELTTAQIIESQWNMRPIAGTVLMAHYGFPATTNVDYSGNANPGTVTGATHGDHVPLGRLFGEYKTPTWESIAGL